MCKRADSSKHIFEPASFDEGIQYVHFFTLLLTDTDVGERSTSSSLRQTLLARLSPELGLRICRYEHSQP